MLPQKTWPEKTWMELLQLGLCSFFRLCRMELHKGTQRSNLRNLEDFFEKSLPPHFARPDLLGYCGLVLYQLDSSIEAIPSFRSVCRAPAKVAPIANSWQAQARANGKRSPCHGERLPHSSLRHSRAASCELHFAPNLADAGRRMRWALVRPQMLARVRVALLHCRQERGRAMGKVPQGATVQGPTGIRAEGARLHCGHGQRAPGW